MTIEIGFVLIAIGFMIFLLVREIGRPELVIFFTVALFILTGIVTPAEGLKGFANEGMLTIALLLIIAGVIQQSGMLSSFVQSLLGKAHSPRIALIRMMIPVSLLSSFMNNTPIVVMFMAYIRDWCEKHNISPSKFLIPLSYASIFGGMITLIGTSTNIIINGIMLEKGMSGYTMFQLAIIGIPGACLAILYMITIGYRLLPNHQVERANGVHAKQYLAEARVERDASIVGKTIQDAGLRNLQGLYLIEIERLGETISPVSPKEKILAGDRLIFTGIVSTIVELNQVKGLHIETNSHLTLEDLKKDHVRLVEAVVSHQSSLQAQTVKETNFRSKYDAAVVAVHRHGERLESKVGEIQLKAGDTLLLLVGTEFNNRFSAMQNDFYLATPVPNIYSKASWKPKFAIGMMIAMILLATFNVLSMFQAALMTVGILIISKTVSANEAKNSLQFNILLLIAASFGIAAALEKTGTATWIAEGLTALPFVKHMIIYLAVLYILTNIMTEFMSNSATAVIMFPIALETANQLGVEPMGFIIAITIAASAGFATPIGYQTNLLVYGIGRYRFIDYVKVGIPLNVIYLIVSVLIINYWYY
jgi:di/tricarboxylate transporter